MGKYVIAYDVGTTGVKTCLFLITTEITLIASASKGYHLYMIGEYGAEQDAEEWWEAMSSTTKKVLKKANISPEEISGISFCSQMQGLVVTDKDGKALRRPMNYLDKRGQEQLKQQMSYGLQISGGNIFKLLPSLYYTKAACVSARDPVWKYKWIEANEPEVFDKIDKIMDVKEYLITRCTGRTIMTEDSAFAFLLYDTRKGHEGWCEPVCKMLGVNMDHLPEIVKSTDVVGGLTKKAAEDLGLCEGTPVFGGGGDASLIGVGAGAVRPGDTYVYSGTSGWVSTVVEKQVLDVFAMIASTVGAQPGLFNYFAELETSGKCLEWCKDHLAEDEAGIYLEKHDVTESTENYEAEFTSLYDYMSQVIDTVPAGANGVIFTPWLHGNRCPVEDPNAGGSFFNIRIENGKNDMFRAVMEGVCFHMRWMLETSEKKVKTSDRIRYVGGGALSDVSSQILADILGRPVETVNSPQNVGAVGAAAVMGVGLGAIGSVGEVHKFIPVAKTFYPNPENKAVYDKTFAVFKHLYHNNKRDFQLLNA